MAVADIGSATSTAASASISGTFSGSASVGDVVVLALGYKSASSPALSTVTDSAGNTWTLAPATQVDNTTSPNAHGTCAYCVVTNAITGGTDTWTMTLASSVNDKVTAAVRITAVSAAPLDVVSAGGTGASTTPAAGSLTTTAADQVLGIAYFAGPGTSLASSWGTVLQNVGTGTSSGNIRIGTAYLAQGAAGATNPAGTISSTSWGMQGLAFKPSGGSTKTISFAATGAGSPAITIGRLRSRSLLATGTASVSVTLQRLRARSMLVAASGRPAISLQAIRPRSLLATGRGVASFTVQTSAAARVFFATRPWYPPQGAWAPRFMVRRGWWPPRGG